MLTQNIKPKEVVTSQQKIGLEVIIIWIIKRAVVLFTALILGAIFLLISILLVSAFFSQQYLNFVENIVPIFIYGILLIGTLLPYSILRSGIESMLPNMPKLKLKNNSVGLDISGGFNEVGDLFGDSGSWSAGGGEFGGGGASGSW